jgi:toxin ParE1/3/4
VALSLLKRSKFLDDYTEIVLRVQEANPVAAHKFCEEVEEALELISQHPEIARLAGFPKAASTRSWPLRRYPNYVLLYRVTDNEIVVQRLLHGARELPPLAGE